jgi:hypothetical protein
MQDERCLGLVELAGNPPHLLIAQLICIYGERVTCQRRVGASAKTSIIPAISSGIGFSKLSGPVVSRSEAAREPSMAKGGSSTPEKERSTKFCWFRL